MGDILSQAEIDNLLNAINSGDGDSIDVAGDDRGKDAKDYNFARPSKFGKEQLRSLENIFEVYSRLVSSFLTGYLRTTTHIEVATAEQVTYSEFSNSLSNPVILSIVELMPLKGSVVLDLSVNIGYSIIDRILGGPGLSIKKIRDFSEIEKILLERIVTQLLNFLPEPWENVERVTPRLEKMETNSQFAQIISPNEMIALVSLSIKIGSVEGFINFCLPHLVLAPVMDRLNTKYWFTTVDDSLDYKDDLEDRLERAKVPVRAVIGKTNVQVSEFISMQVGDIIPLDSYLNSDLDIMVGNILKFQAKPGINRGKNAIQITSVIRKEE